MRTDTIPNTKSDPRPNEEAPQLTHAEPHLRKLKLELLEQRLAPGRAVIDF